MMYDHAKLEARQRIGSEKIHLFHITGGTWPHAKGIDPCKVRIQDKGVDRV